MRATCLALATAIFGSSLTYAIAVAPDSVQASIQQGQEALNSVIDGVLHNDLVSAQLQFNIAASKISDLGYYLASPTVSCGFGGAEPTYNHTSQKSQQSVVGSVEAIQIRLSYLSSSLLYDDTASALSAWQFSMASLDSTYDYIFADQHIDDSPSKPANASASVFGMVQAAQTSLNLLLLDLQTGNKVAARSNYNDIHATLFNDLAPMVPCKFDAQSSDKPCIASGTAASSVSYSQIVTCVQNVQQALVEMASDVLANSKTDKHCALAGQDFTATHDYIFQ